eukprot:CAMPEP_0184520214 /NCGR_PEP_ID=MMETSP0198_2-20121128/7045_1 /TAXON_ID=1112570 /ORGANISM="Thraustochytrium sp., Strain LLF1b" /LENGTH=83 /DNA_ID=CAMNT_0026910791 /DNA_START=960 /DNA_END=1207 /DNA_ORIENTATION=+
MTEVCAWSATFELELMARKGVSPLRRTPPSPGMGVMLLLLQRSSLEGAAQAVRRAGWVAIARDEWPPAALRHSAPRGPAATTL